MSIAPLIRRPASDSDFEEVLVLFCCVLALAAGLRLWWIVTSIAIDTWRGRSPTARWQGAGPLTRGLLLACGVAVLWAAGPSTWATAGSGDDAGGPAAILDGLPLPDRSVGGPRRHPVPPANAAPQVAQVSVVRPGDTLWGIATRQLDATASPDEIAAYVAALHRANRSTIGSDPNLIRPGQALRLPRPTTP